MKQSADPRPVLNLDDLERQLQAAVDPKKSYADDPLAELARIVKQDDPLRSSGSSRPENTQPLSFDDFLKVPPRSASGVMPRHTPSIEPLFSAPDTGTRGEQSEHFRGISASEPVQLPESGLFLDEAEEIVGGVNEQNGETEQASAKLRPEQALPADAFDDDFDLRLSQALSGPQGDSQIAEALALEDYTVEQVAANQDAAPAKAPFDDMLAEFEAAMRGVGGEPTAQDPVPSLDPVVVPPPPPGYSAIAGAAGAAVVAATALGAASANAGSASIAAAHNASLPRKTGFASRRGLMIAAGVVGVAVIGMGSLLGFGGGLRKAPPVNAPVIAAKPGVTKERPANPGGVEVPNQDKEVLQSKPQTAAVERVAPREEQPVDLAAAQQRVQATPEVAATPPAAVRQIPGIAIVAPISITPPPATPAQANAPVPRPVASVPITIAGQSTPASPPSAPAPSVVAPAAQVPATAPATSSAAPPATPATEPPVSAPALRTVQPANAEPRRVRAVPIRADNAAAPPRGQSQQRAVSVAPGVQPAEEPDVANAPLRITPQSQRSAPQRVASAAPNQPAQAPATTRTTSATGSFAVQLAAEGSSDSARSKFNRIKGQHSSVLGGFEPDIRTAEVNGRNVYRVRVGSLSREEAVSVCERLKANGGTCFVARN